MDIPKEMSRRDFVNWVECLGFKATEVTELRADHDGITVEYVVLDSGGKATYVEGEVLKRYGYVEVVND